MERILLILTALALIIILILAIKRSGKTSKNNIGILQRNIINIFLVPDKSDKVCLRKGCIISASSLFDYMNETVNPCEDFYQFACGNFIKEATFPEFSSSIGSSTVIKTKIMNQIRNLLEEASYPNEPRMSTLPKKFYNSCMNKTTGKENKDALEAIFERFGGWPVLNESAWNEKEFDWKKTILNLNKDGHKYEFLFYIFTKVENATSKILTVSNLEHKIPFSFLRPGISR